MNSYEMDRDELGIVQSASKIWEKISILRNLDELNKLRYSRRWIWELLQNAKDVSDKDVNIKIDYYSNQIIFSHDGKKFTCKDLLSLVTQTSFKEIEKEEATGKFGTGFITTHLICEKIDIVGLIDDYNNRTKKLEFSLDRSGKNRTEIQSLLKEQLSKIKEINDLDTVSEIDDEVFATSFIYEVKEHVSEIVRHGVCELYSCSPYVLVFVPRINSITIKGKEESIFQLGNSYNCDELGNTYSFEQQGKALFICNYNDITVAIPINSEDKKSVVELEENIPRIFCDFPLIGTEKFPLPTVINSKKFDVTEPRDGIMLGSEKNKELLCCYVEAYRVMLIKLAQKNYKNLHLLCKIGNSEDVWLQENILNKLKLIYRRIPIVMTREGRLDKIETEDGDVNILFPFENNNQVKNEVWELCAQLNWGSKKIPDKGENLKWITVVTEDKFKLTITKILKMINDFTNIDQLRSKLEKDVGELEWINFLIRILYNKNELENEIARNRMIPNQKGEFCLDSRLKKDEAISDELKDILTELGEDIRRDLRNNDIIIPLEENKECLTNLDIAAKIRTKVYRLLQQENEPGAKRTRQTKDVFEKLLLWFSNNPEEAEKTFSDLYECKHKLYDEKDIIDNIRLSQEVKLIMKDYEIEDINQIKDIIKGVQAREVVTDIGLACMGITSEEEFEWVFENEEVKACFTYNSKPTPETFLYVQEIIQRAKKNVLSYLKKFPDEYNCNMYQETATTVLAGIKKNGKPIKMVVRPSDGDKIYIYYQSELDTMDYEDYELWVDNNTDDPRRITFGKLLKITGVKVIPLRKIFY